MTSNEICNTSLGTITTFNITLNELIDPKGQENMKKI